MMKCARSIGLVATVIASLIAPGVSTPAAAAPSQHLNWGSNLSSGSDSCPPGSLVINVKQRVLNDIDSGEQANYWAFDDFVRSIQVVEVSAGAFCATVKYQGQFTTVEGPAPGKTDAVGAGVVGTFEGGYVSTIFFATRLSSPTKRTVGNIGSIDYLCNPTTGDCPGFVDWTTFYFASGASFDFAWWGWVYHAGNNGSWVNAIDGNSGNITGN